MNIPNLITIFRILLVPLTVWLLTTQSFMIAFIVFVIAGLSDGIDGFLARRFNWQSELGSYLDPLADKTLLVSIFVMLGILRFVPDWLVFLVVTRDIMIISAVMLSWLMDKPVSMQPLWISKVTTVGQIIFAGSALFLLGLEKDATNSLFAGSVIVAVLTVASGSLYLRNWLQHMNNGNPSDPSA